MRRSQDSSKRLRRTKCGGGNVMAYNHRKQDVIREIYDRLFRAAGLL